jgi:hypothetical protein
MSIPAEAYISVIKVAFTPKIRISGDRFGLNNDPKIRKVVFAPLELKRSLSHETEKTLQKKAQIKLIVNINFL